MSNAAFSSGFNEERVRTSLTTLNTNYTNLMSTFQTKVQSFVTEISTQWASPNAVKVFTEGDESIQSVIRNLAKEINTTMESVNKAINSAAARKASDNGDIHSNVPFDDYTFSVNYSAIVKSINGNVGVDKTTATTTANKLNQIPGDTDSYLNAISSALSNSGILDATAQTELNNSVASIRRNIKSKIESIVEGVISAIDITVKENGDSDGAIARAFSGQ